MIQCYDMEVTGWIIRT